MSPTSYHCSTPRRLEQYNGSLQGCQGYFRVLGRPEELDLTVGLQLVKGDLAAGAPVHGAHLDGDAVVLDCEHPADVAKWSGALDAARHCDDAVDHGTAGDLPTRGTGSIDPIARVAIPGWEDAPGRMRLLGGIPGAVARIEVVVGCASAGRDE